MDDAKKNLLAEDNSILSLLLKFRLEREVCKLPTDVNRKKATDLIQKQNSEFISTDTILPLVSRLKPISPFRNKLNKPSPLIIFSLESQEEKVFNSLNTSINNFGCVSISNIFFRTKPFYS